MKLNLITEAISFVSIGRIGAAFGVHAKRMGVDVKCAPLMVDETKAPFSREVKKLFVATVPRPAFVIASISGLDRVGSLRDTVLMTFIETTQAKPEFVASMNECKAIIAASKWNAQVFRESGVKVPIHVVNLGIDTEVFKPRIDVLPKGCIISTVGRMMHGPRRKNIDLVMYAFLRTLADKEDAMLWVKCFDDCALPDIKHPRIQVIRDFLTEEKMAAFYQESTAVVFGSAAEGFGLPQLEAIMCGKPIANVNFGGVREFFRPGKNGYLIESREEKVEYTYNNCGSWQTPSFDSLCETMKYIYKNRVDALAMGLQGAKKVRHMSYEWMTRNVLEVLKKYRIVL